MNRRDTVLIAVLINMALLVALFLGAIKPSSAIEIVQAKINEADRPEKKIALQSQPPQIDQVDAILSKFVENEVKAQNLIDHGSSSEEVAQSRIAMPLLKPEHRQDNVKEIIVRSGDVLEKIAKNHRTSVDAIMKLNRLNDTKLQIGQILYVPIVKEGEVQEIVAPAPSPTSIASQSPLNQRPEPKYYTVKNGDNPWTISIKNNIKVEELLRLNNLDESKAKKLKPGDKLRIQ